MITRDNLKEVLLDLSESSKEFLRESGCEWEYAEIHLHVFNVGTYTALNGVTNEIPEDFESDGLTVYLPVPEVLEVIGNG